MVSKVADKTVVGAGVRGAAEVMTRAVVTAEAGVIVKVAILL